MDRSKLVAIVTGAIALALSIAYLIVVQLLDLRGEMIPAPMGWIISLAGEHLIGEFNWITGVLSSFQ